METAKRKFAIFVQFATCLILSACGRLTGDDAIPAVCATPEPVSGDEIVYTDLIYPNCPDRYELRGIALGVDGKTALAQDIFISHDHQVSTGRTRCKASDGGMASFHLGEVDPNLNIPLGFQARDGHYSNYLDLFFHNNGRGLVTEGRLSESLGRSTFGRFLTNLKAGGASVRLFRDQDGIYLMVEKMTGESYIYRAKIFFKQI